MRRGGEGKGGGGGEGGGSNFQLRRGLKGINNLRAHAARTPKPLGGDFPPAVLASICSVLGRAIFTLHLPLVSYVFLPVFELLFLPPYIYLSQFLL